jgi:predicted enzyme related to lactoylglutathione lyase
MQQGSSHPVVHMELHTGSLESALGFYSSLFGWRSELIDAGPSSYVGLDLGGRIEGGAVECGAGRPIWLPYVEVENVAEATDRARLLGASVLLEPREGPAGWRSVLCSPAGAEVALWQPKPSG